jgi:hypothetical protein
MVAWFADAMIGSVLDKSAALRNVRRYLSSPGQLPANKYCNDFASDASSAINGTAKAVAADNVT